MISTKKLVNSPETCVDESIGGFVAMHPGVRQLAGEPRVIVRADIDDYRRLGKVVTVTGGGSGHEPCFTGTYYKVILDCHPLFHNLFHRCHGDIPGSHSTLISPNLPKLSVTWRDSDGISKHRLSPYFYSSASTL